MTTKLLVHDPKHQCPECLQYQQHISMDLVLETESIMLARDDCMKFLSCILGWNEMVADLREDLASARHDCDYWRRRAEEAEKASTFSKEQTSATFEQAHLLSMYIPSACLEDTPGAGPSN